MNTKEEQLHMAIRNGDRNRVEELLNKDHVDINCVYYGMTPLLVAISKSKSDIQCTSSFARKC